MANMPTEENSSREVGHARRQPLCHQRPELPNELCVRPRRRCHEFVRMVALHHAVVVPAGGADEAQRKMGISRGQMLKRKSELQDFRYRHVASRNALCRRLEPREHRPADAVMRHALPLELHDGSKESLGSIAVYAVVGQLQRYVQPAATSAGPESVLPTLMHVVAGARRNGQVSEGVPQSCLEAPSESQDDGRKGVVSRRAVDQGERGHFDSDLVQTLQDGLAFVVALFASAEDLRVARDLDRVLLAWSDGEKFFVNLNSELCR